ncbi:hypothetical protein M8J76_017057 [Diaphorina citri]|nr:hypothetical protein M8J75_016015 [Diaphorina citri]KAI5719950.1 hypothetical protein M8J76_017057 [Diaphorina citri]KAI5720364.1 hypothetical protein M8J77_005469 [Diaphorina citri]
MARKTINSEMIQNMLNNHRYSDLTFSVNESIYYANRYVVAGASDVFEALVNGHFQESSAKQIVIKDIVYDKSFYNILAYVYSHELDFRIIPETVLCEMLRLAQMYNLSPLYDVLKTDLNKLEYYHTGSAVELINTAKNHNMEDLYERMKTFIFQNAKYILEHETFVNIQYDILLELLKSSSFHDKEINIFKGVLKWINDNQVLAMSDLAKKDALILDLLKQVRYSQISLGDYVCYKEESNSLIKLFSKYKKIVHDKKSEISVEPRVKPTEYLGILVHFTAKKVGEEWDKCYFSPLYEVKNLQFRLIIKLDPTKISDSSYVSIMLDCKPVHKCEYWECVVEYSFKLNSTNCSKVSDTPSSYNNTFSISEPQHGSTNHVTVKRFFDYCVDEDDNSFEVQLTIEPEDPKFT